MIILLFYPLFFFMNWNKHNWLFISIIILTFLGIINAFYLSYEAHQISQLVSQPSYWTLFQWWFVKNTFCDINETFSCSSFMANPASKLFWIPFPYIAAIVYPILFILSLMAFRLKSNNIVRTIFILSLMWIWFNVIIISREFTLWVFCPACLMCTAYIISIAILSGIILKNNKKVISK